jgi:hypothetical protein
LDEERTFSAALKRGHDQDSNAIDAKTIPTIEERMAAQYGRKVKTVPAVEDDFGASAVDDDAPIF